MIFALEMNFKPSKLKTVLCFDFTRVSSRNALPINVDSISLRLQSRLDQCNLSGLNIKLTH